ncbi:MAG: beta family protein [Terriglobales bacterium]
MPPQLLYIPVLKGKEGEFAALEALDPEVRSHLMPLIEIPPVQYDYVNERPAKTLDEHVRGIADRLRKAWREQPLYLDLPFEEDGRLSDGRVALAAVLEDCAGKGVSAVPVISRESAPECLAAAGRYSTATNSGVCLRLRVGDFEEDVEPDSDVERLITGLGGVANEEMDLVIDLEDLGPDTGRALLVARSIFYMVPKMEVWRRVILTGASFPEDLSDVGAATISTLPRREWELWNTLQRRPKLLPRPDLIFGDYAISHPVIKELDPRVMLMSASIRYTTPDHWLIVKGRNVRHYGFDQYFELCQVLVKRNEYCGSDFSWGDRYIADCAEGIQGPGNATTWRKVGTNHHLTLVVRELAKRLAS